MSDSEPFRSAVPLAAAGIVCLGLVPILGGPERALHWAMTAGMVGFGALLWARRRLHGSEGPLQPVPQHLAQRTGRCLLFIVGILAVIVGAIAGFRLHSGEPIAALSLVLPGAGLAWVLVLGIQTLRYREPPAGPLAAGDRPSRRPPIRDQVPKPQSPSSRSGSEERHVGA